MDDGNIPSDPALTSAEIKENHLDVIPTPTTTGDEQLHNKLNVLDILPNIHLVLELVVEQGTGGLVDKIIISGESFGTFLNTITPGSYISMTRIDFKSLDTVSLEPIGLYGPKEAIVAYLLGHGIIEEQNASLMLKTTSDEKVAPLPSGIYISRNMNNNRVAVFYWPEDKTWFDDAPSSIQQNRTTFMRYLSKITDQLICLLPESHSSLLVFSQPQEEIEVDDFGMDEDIDRLFTFEVAKTLEQEEGVNVAPGFQILLDSNTLDVDTSTSGLAPGETRLVVGDTAIGIMTARVLDPKETQTTIHRTLTSLAFRQFFHHTNVIVGPSFDLEHTPSLMEGLENTLPDLTARWTNGQAEILQELQETQSKSAQKAEEIIAASVSSLKNAIRVEALVRLRDLDANLFGVIHGPEVPSESDATETSSTNESSFKEFVGLYPHFESKFSQAFPMLKAEVKNKDFRTLKRRIITAVTIMDSEEFNSVQDDRKENAIKAVLQGDELDLKTACSAESEKSLLRRFLSMFSADNSLHALQQRVDKRSSDTKSHRFLVEFREICTSNPLLVEAYRDALNIATRHYQKILVEFVERVFHQCKRVQEDFLKQQASLEAQSKRRSMLDELSSSIVAELNSQTISYDQTLNIQSVKSFDINYGSDKKRYELSAIQTTRSPPRLEYKIVRFEISSDQRHQLQMDPTFVPTPQTNDRFSHKFTLGIKERIIHVQFVSNDRILLVVDDNLSTFSVYLEYLSSLSGATSAHRHRRTIQKERVGNKILVSWDDTKRMLAVCATEKAQLHIFVCDDDFATLNVFSAPFQLAPWFDSPVSMIALVSGNEEVLLIDSGATAKLFSLNTQQCRPAVLSFNTRPQSIHISPEGSCFFAVFASDEGLTMTAYHWSTFGSSVGVNVDLVGIPTDLLGVSSLVSRNNVHLMGVNVGGHKAKSLCLNITKKATEFMFQEKGNLSSQGGKPGADTRHNCLVDCHRNVWVRFPVTSCIERHTTTSARRCEKRLIFASDIHHDFGNYFASMIRTFESSTKKPTGLVLKSIGVESAGYQGTCSGGDNTVALSNFNAGEWVVDLLCLIPIHIAVTKENRFIPLKDGLSSSEHERSLLGADLSTVVDSISFGWYESILQSYMAQKPVKIVSSMGEQSVGKSYSLNHLLDTSFAGSAMRTTEGVWMSITPTSDTLLIALDFEGVHSIERSAQEDTLLVLFNTAISNLVLFRNNFALSRDVTGLFHSFQASSSVLDPSANPTLFKSTLAIIIKDVVDSDKKEIVREFSTKFQKIVQDEQEANFISRLHAGNLTIIPWPVIESRGFYGLFPALITRLKQQPITHPSAGQFLHTIKTLMAKLKINDWRALSQSMAAHRVHQILSRLMMAVTTGMGDLGADGIEYLKDFDTNIPVIPEDSDSIFSLSTPETVQKQGDRELILQTLSKSWSRYGLRPEYGDQRWTTELSMYLTSLADQRIEHVRHWLSINLKAFPADNPSIVALHRTVDAMFVDLKASIELCKHQCSECGLLCIFSRHHIGTSPHDCTTNHKCPASCEYSDSVDPTSEHMESCGYPAGHDGKHVCDVEAHLCGDSCSLSGRNGCLGKCVQIAGHQDGEHMCSARIHACGEPCQLNITPGTNSINKGFICTGKCATSCDEDHTEHLCDDRTCPMPCELCNRRCCSTDHLHGLVPGEHHLCGEEHPCKSLCATVGICQIETAPQSIEATFTGRHETFQYTKYSQVAKRLPCVVSIPPFELRHRDPHQHSTDPRAFHFCEERCENCGYYCTLPRGHTQKEHETSHGSMSRSKWALESPDATVELNGRKFASDDDGAPMMCNLVCQSLGRHTHLDYCRSPDGAACRGSEHQHITTRMNPNPNKAKDWITHKLFWQRSGFKGTDKPSRFVIIVIQGDLFDVFIVVDPYSREDRATFERCDSMCPGTEHKTSNAGSGAPQPSHCVLPLFHTPKRTDEVSAGLGYVSNDGHQFSCKNPVVMHQAFHIIFVIDRSGSMGYTDRLPLQGTPVTSKISARNNNRLGAVYSSLHAFWASRNAALSGASAPNRRDAYSVILFDDATIQCVLNDFTSTADGLLDKVLQHGAGGGTNYTLALQTTEHIMRQHWSTERSPVVIFLSDGECSVEDQTIRTLCRASVTKGKPLSFHAVSFGSHNAVLQRMTHIALEVQNGAKADPTMATVNVIDSSFSLALDSVRLAETFLGLAESLKKPRGSLVRGSG